MTTTTETKVTTRMLKTARKPRKPVIVLLCPSCRASRRCTPAGTASVDGKRREVVQCSEKTCELLWVPAKIHVPASAPQAA